MTFSDFPKVRQYKWALDRRGVINRKKALELAKHFRGEGWRVRVRKETRWFVDTAATEVLVKELGI